MLKPDTLSPLSGRNPANGVYGFEVQASGEMASLVACEALRNS